MFQCSFVRNWFNWTPHSQTLLEIYTELVHESVWSNANHSLWAQKRSAVRSFWDIPVPLSQTCEQEAERTHERHWHSACNVPAKNTQNTCTHGSHTCVQYLHHPLKHMGQREEGDEHIFSAGFECALNIIHRARSKYPDEVFRFFK